MTRFCCAPMVAALLPAAFAAAAIDVKVNNDVPGTIQNEVSLTLVPTMPGRVVVGYNDFVTPAPPLPPVGLGVSYSADSGATWTDTQLSVPTHPILPPSPDSGIPLSNIFDPISGADTQGRAYAGYIATDNSGPGAPSGVYVEFSDDGGVTWSGSIPPGPTSVSFSTRATSNVPGSDPNYRFNDKPHLTVDRSGGSFNDNVYVGFIQDVNVGQPTSDILFSRSTDRGLTFSTPIKISDAPSGGVNGGKGNGPNVAVASDGTVYAAWLDVDVTNTAAKPGTLMFDKSTDGGLTFGSDVSVATIRSVANNLSTSTGSGDDARARSYPSIAVDPANPQNVYLVYAEDPDFTPQLDGPDEADIFLRQSTDGGSTWSSRLRINDDATTTDQFEPWIAAKPDGTIDVAWYDKRLDPANDQQWDVYLATSIDGGMSFLPNVRVSDQSFAAPNPFAPAQPAGFPWLGEYLGLAVDNRFAYIGFTASTGDAAGDVFFDRIRNPASVVIPEPSTLAVWSLLAGLGIGLRRRRKAALP